MEIHSSSLSFFTARENPKNNRNTSLSSPLKKDNSALATPPLAVKKLSKTKADRIPDLSNDIKKPQNIASNMRSSQALNLYRQEHSQSLQNQGTALISKIDFFI